MTKKGATGDFFFSFLQKKLVFFFPKMENTKKKNVKKKKNCGHPTGHNFGHPLDRKHTFFYGQPKGPDLPPPFLFAVLSVE